MGEWIKKFWTDPVFFAATIRGLITTLGALLASGLIPLPDNWWKVGMLVMASGNFIPAKAAPLTKQVDNAKPDERTNILEKLQNIPAALPPEKAAEVLFPPKP
jgi:hypothetical protein